MIGSFFFGGSPRRRPGRRGAGELGRFRRSRRLGEEFAAKLVQTVTLALLVLTIYVVFADLSVLA